MTHKAIENIKKMFEGIDLLDWAKIHVVMAEQVLLDFTSITGGQPGLMSPQQITNIWSDILPGFDKTHHQLSNFESKIEEEKKCITFDGKIDHFLNGSVWTVIGNYFVETEEDHKISFLKFNFKYAKGESSLPQKAVEKVYLRKEKK